MARLRYVRDRDGTPATAGKLNSSVTSLRCLYHTEPAIHAALLPAPLTPSKDPVIFIQHANVAMHVSDTDTIEIGAATVGVKCDYQGSEGYYVLSMPMQGEFVVITGRERFGEPKKLAQVASMERDGSHVTTCIARHGITFLEMRGEVAAESSAPRSFSEYFYCHKALPRIDQADGFDGPVYLTRLCWERSYDAVYPVANPEVILRESAYDPLVDVPVLDIISMELAQGSTRTSGEIVTEIPGENLVDFIHQRYDNPGVAALDVSLA